MRQRGRGVGNFPTRGRGIDVDIPPAQDNDPATELYQKIDYTQLGARLKVERNKLHYTQESVAEKIGISAAFVGHIERAERSLSLDTLIKLCNLYRVSIDYLLTDIVTTETDNSEAEITALLDGKSKQQKNAILDILKAVCRNI